MGVGIRRNSAKIVREAIAFTIITHLAIGMTAQSSPKDVHARRMTRGKYLVEGPAHCFACHSEPDVEHGSDHPIPGRKGSGRVQPTELTKLAGVPAPYRVVCPNITPDRETGAGTWSDADFVRALRQGIGHDGRTLFPMMPYRHFHELSDEDIASIVTYVRSIPAVRNALPKTELPPAVKAGLQPLPDPGSVKPDLSTPEKRGAYLVLVGNCEACHTPIDSRRQPLPGMYLAGGRTFPTPWGVVTSANITPDPSGISYYDEKKFIEVIRTGHVGARKLNPFMPASYIRELSDRDLRDLFAYLRTVPPVKHRVDNTETATTCKVCNGKHGFGERN